MALVAIKLKDSESLLVFLLLAFDFSHSLGGNQAEQNSARPQHSVGRAAAATCPEHAFPNLLSPALFTGQFMISSYTTLLPGPVDPASGVTRICTIIWIYILLTSYYDTSSLRSRLRLVTCVAPTARRHSG